VAEQFGVGTTTALLPLSLYVLALGLGPILGAPLSETYGRQMIYLLSPPLGALFTLGSGFAPNFATLAILRFLAGMFFSPSLAIGAGTIADTHPPWARAPATTLYILSPFLGPALGCVHPTLLTVITAAN
jgi:MFS family permease